MKNQTVTMPQVFLKHIVEELERGVELDEQNVWGKRDLRLGLCAGTYCLQSRLALTTLSERLASNSTVYPIEDSDAEHRQDDAVRPPQRKRRKANASTTGGTAAQQQTHQCRTGPRSRQIQRLPRPLKRRS